MKTNKSILSALVLTSLIGGVAGATTVTDNDINVGQGNTNNASYTIWMVCELIPMVNP